MADTHHYYYVTEYDLLVTVLVYSRWLDRRMIHNSGLDITERNRSMSTTWREGILRGYDLWISDLELDLPGFDSCRYVRIIFDFPMDQFTFSHWPVVNWPRTIT